MRYLSLLLGLFISCSNDKVQDKNEFHMNLGYEPSSLHPLVYSDGASLQVQSYVLDCLLYRNPDTFEFEPGVAESYSISNDGKTFTFKLRPNLKFSDGSPLTSADVKSTFDSYFDPEQNAAALKASFENFAGVDAPDPKTVIFRVKNTYFHNFRQAAAMSILPAKYYKDPKESKKLSLQLYGSGPYKIESFERGKKLLLTKNDHWWGYHTQPRSPMYNWDKIHYYFIMDDTVRLENFKKGRLDYIDGIDPQVWETQLEGPGWGTRFIKVKTQNKVNSSYNYIGWQLKNPRFTDKRVRKALAHLMNRKMIAEKFMHGHKGLANGPTPMGRDDNNEKVAPIEFDLEKAKALFKEAGWSDSDKDGILDKIVDGKKIDMRFTIFNSSESINKWLTIYKEDALKAGVDIEITFVEWNLLIKNLAERRFDAVTLSLGVGSNEYDYKDYWHSDSSQKGGMNEIDYSNPEVDKLIDQHRITTDRNARLQIGKEIFRLIAEDSPFLFMFYGEYATYVHNNRIVKPKDSFNYAVGMDYWKWRGAAK